MRPTKKEMLAGSEISCRVLGIKIPGKLTLKWIPESDNLEAGLAEGSLEIHYRKPGAKRRGRLGYAVDTISLKNIKGDVAGLLRFLNLQQNRAENFFDVDE